MRWWPALTMLQKVVFVVLIVCLLGTTGSLIWNYPVAPFSFAGFVAVVVNAVIYVRRGLSAPVPGRPELSKSDDTTR